MNTQAYFENIQSHILRELNRAQTSITIAVAWFTDKSLFNVLCSKASAGIRIQLLLMNDDINNSSGIDYNHLQESGGKLWKVGGGNADSLMHNKFCIIDGQTVINGSYNWTNRAQQNHESITVINDAGLADQFENEFEEIKAHYSGTTEKGTTLDYNKINNRLDILKNLIVLEDEDDIDYQLSKLKKIIPSPGHDDNTRAVWEIIEKINRKHFHDAIHLMDNFLNKFRSLSVYVDAGIIALQLEIKALGIQISALEDEKSEIEKLVYEFKIQQDNELGALISEVFRLRNELLKEEAKHDATKAGEAQEAEEEYRQYNEAYQETKGKKIRELSENERTYLKSAFRKASKLCHPDRVSALQKEQAEATFVRLKEAYDNNDLETVAEILTNLNQGVFSANGSEINEKQQLILLVNQLRTKRSQLEENLLLLKQSELYQTVSDLDDWAKYFLDLKVKLEEELQRLKQLFQDRNPEVIFF
jgi:hypothetical protein